GEPCRGLRARREAHDARLEGDRRDARARRAVGVGPVPAAQRVPDPLRGVGRPDAPPPQVDHAPLLPRPGGDLALLRGGGPPGRPGPPRHRGPPRRALRPAQDRRSDALLPRREQVLWRQSLGAPARQVLAGDLVTRNRYPVTGKGPPCPRGEDHAMSASATWLGAPPPG